jgi:hypothetical protein
MNKIMQAIAKYFFFAFVAGLLVWAGNMTIHAVKTALPSDPIAPFMALALFDAGALAWLGAFLYAAKGTHQRATALLLTCFDVAGVIYMTGGGLNIVDTRLIGIGLLVATLANYGALYFYHANSPEAHRAILAQNLEDELNEEAMHQAKIAMQSEARKLGAILAKRATAEIKYRMRLPMSVRERREWEGNGDVIDAQAEDLPALPSPAPHPFWAGLLGFFGLGQNQPQDTEVMDRSSISNSITGNTDESTNQE